MVGCTQPTAETEAAECNRQNQTTSHRAETTAGPLGTSSMCMCHLLAAIASLILAEAGCHRLGTGKHVHASSEGSQTQPRVSSRPRFALNPKTSRAGSTFSHQQISQLVTGSRLAACVLEHCAAESNCVGESVPSLAAGSPCHGRAVSCCFEVVPRARSSATFAYRFRRPSLPIPRTVMTDIVRNLLRSIDDDGGAPPPPARSATALALATPRRQRPPVSTTPGSAQQLVLATGRAGRPPARSPRLLDSPVINAPTCAICRAVHSEASQQQTTASGSQLLTAANNRQTASSKPQPMP